MTKVETTVRTKVRIVLFSRQEIAIPVGKSAGVIFARMEQSSEPSEHACKVNHYN